MRRSSRQDCCTNAPPSYTTARSAPPRLKKQLQAHACPFARHQGCLPVHRAVCLKTRSLCLHVAKLLARLLCKFNAGLNYTIARSATPRQRYLRAQAFPFARLLGCLPVHTALCLKARRVCKEAVNELDRNERHGHAPEPALARSLHFWQGRYLRTLPCPVDEPGLAEGSIPLLTCPAGTRGPSATRRGPPQAPEPAVRGRALEWPAPVGASAPGGAAASGSRHEHSTRRLSSTATPHSRERRPAAGPSAAAPAGRPRPPSPRPSHSFSSW